MRHAARVSSGTTTASQGVDDVAPRAARDRWLPIVERLVAAGGTIHSRALTLGEERGAITVMYKERTGEAEARFVRELDAVMSGLGMQQLETWHAIYQAMGAGSGVSVTTECTAGGPAAQLAVLYGHSSWDRVIDLVKLAVDSAGATRAAVRLGLLAGELGGDPRGVEIVVGASTIDLLVWLVPAR